MGSVEAGDERQITVADDWQLKRLACSSLTGTAVPCPGDISGPSQLQRSMQKMVMNVLAHQDFLCCSKTS